MSLVERELTCAWRVGRRGTATFPGQHAGNDSTSGGTATTGRVGLLAGGRRSVGGRCLGGTAPLMLEAALSLCCRSAVEMPSVSVVARVICREVSPS